jgi:hypothetical protein
MTNDMQQLAALLLQNRKGGDDFGEISHLEGRECSKGIANRFLICCLLDFQQNAAVAWKKGEVLAEKLGGAENVWLAISSFPKAEWDSRYEESDRPHRYRWGYARLWGIANTICARYNGDARNIWCNRSPYDALVHLWAVGAGDQISRMIVGALRDSGQIKGRHRGRESGRSSPTRTWPRSIWPRDRGRRCGQDHRINPTTAPTRPVATGLAPVESRKGNLPRDEPKMQGVLSAASLCLRSAA